MPDYLVTTNIYSETATAIVVKAPGPVAALSLARDRAQKIDPTATWLDYAFDRAEVHEIADGLVVAIDAPH